MTVSRLGVTKFGQNIFFLLRIEKQGIETFLKKSVVVKIYLRKPVDLVPFRFINSDIMAIFAYKLQYENLTCIQIKRISFNSLLC